MQKAIRNLRKVEENKLFDKIVLQKNRKDFRGGFGKSFPQLSNGIKQE